MNQHRLLKHLFLAIASLIMLYPLLWMLSSSFKPENIIFNDLSLWPSQFTFDNYPSGWKALRIEFSIFYKNSIIVAVFSVIGNLVSCAFTAYAFARLEFNFKRFWFALMMMTLMLPYHVVLIPQYILFLNLGWVNTYYPLIVPKFLAQDAFFIFLMVQFFKQLPRELDESAMMDGCSVYRIFFKIILPLSTPAFGTAAIFSFYWTWEDFFGPLIYLNDIEKYTVPLALRGFISAEDLSFYGESFAMSILSLIPVFIFFIIFQRFIIHGIAMSGIKG
ncbi:MAG: carbohydrate ABC transporter permease [Deltaproteobacteria bacterium]